jgi:hypothetical protein
MVSIFPRIDSIVSKRGGEVSMLWALVVIIFLFWLIGGIGFHIGGGLINLLLVLVVIGIVYNLFIGRGTGGGPLL